MLRSTKNKWDTIKVYCGPEEKVLLNTKAAATSLTLSKYLLRLGLAHKVKSLLDHQRVAELAKVNGDLGRLGGLLKLWLSDDKRSAHFDIKTIRALLAKLESTQQQLRQIMQTVIKS